MKRERYKKILVVLLVGILATGFVATVGAEGAEAGWVEKTPLQKFFSFLSFTGDTKQSFVVVDETGKGVANAYVRVSWFGGSNYGYTNSGGAVSLGVDSNFLLTVYTQKSGYVCVDSAIYCHSCTSGTTCLKTGFHYHAYASMVLGLKKAQPQPTPTPPQVCTPYEIKCRNGNNLERCSYDGSKWGFYQSCTYGCTIGARTCNPAPTHTPTPTPTPQICTPYETCCSGNDLEGCNSQGSGWIFLKTCDWGCVCSPTPCHCEVEPTQTPTPTTSPTPTPTPDPGTCTPGEERCFGEYLKTCNSAGDGWDEGKTELCGWGCDADKRECAKLLPGFEAMFAIAGVLATAFLVVRRRRVWGEKGKNEDEK